MDFAVFFSREFTGLHVDSMWTLQGLLMDFAVFLVESYWTPCGLHRDCVICYCIEFTGVPVDSIWTPHEFAEFFCRVFTGLHMDSTWTLQYFLVESLLDSTGDFVIF